MAVTNHDRPAPGNPTLLRGDNSKAMVAPLLPVDVSAPIGAATNAGATQQAKTPPLILPEARTDLSRFRAASASAAGVKAHELLAPRPSPRVNLVYITTLSELAGDEQVGQVVFDRETGRSYGRRVGNLEHLVRQLNDPRSPLAGRFNLVGVAFDDDPQHVDNHNQTAAPWPWDLTVPLRAADGSKRGTATLGELALNLPSSPWRAVKDPTAKAAAKAEYEKALVRWLDSVGADLVISDSYTRIVGPTLLDWLGTGNGERWGRGINVHPAVAAVGDPRRLPGITPTRDAYTRARHGYIIIDDKKAVDLPEGERITVSYEGKERQAVKVAPVMETAVTVHVVAPRVDNGAPIAVKGAALPAGVTYEGIRVINYELKKEALTAALESYTREPEVRRLIDERRKENGRPPLGKARGLAA